MDLSRHTTPDWLWEESSSWNQGDHDLADRQSLQRVSGISTELDDVTEVEYRALRLERVVLIGVWSGKDQADAYRSMNELQQLATTAGSIVLEGVIQKRDIPDPSTYIGSGKAEELREIVLRLKADTVICDGELTGAQLTALEKIVKVKVIDRTALILDIFAQHAVSKEGKAQVALAQMQYMLPRLRGWGEALSRQAGGRAGSGGVGLRGPGETKIETDRRRIRDRMAKLRAEINEMKTARDIKRSARNKGYTPRIAIVGYTNAGKSSLLNVLSDANSLVQNALFATLEPMTRKAKLASGLHVVFTDTVGFVSHLPHQLVDAFTSTLEEILEADFIIHIVDSSDSMPEKHIQTVRTVLDELSARYTHTLPDEILVFNKCDRLTDEDRLILRHKYPESVWVSALKGEGIPQLEQVITDHILSSYPILKFHIPYDRGEIIELINQHGIIVHQEYDASGTSITAQIPPSLGLKIPSEFSQ